MENQSPAKPTFTQPGPAPAPAPRAEDLGGMFGNVSSVPTLPARKLSEQIQIVSGVPYIYDNENDQWVRMSGATIYTGIVAADGTAVSLPSGWTSTKNSTGSYTITHNLGTTSWSATVSVNSNSLRAAQLGPDAPESNTMDVYVFKPSDLTQDDARFTFILVVHDN